MLKRSKGASLRSTALSAMLLAALGAGVGAAGMAMAQSAGQATLSFDIPAQSLGGALTDFGRQSGLQVSADASLLAGKSSPGVTGAMSAETALTSLLSGTGLMFRMAGDVVLLEAGLPAEDGVITTGALSVEGTTGGAGRGAGVTEGTGSYTTTSVSLGKTDRALRDIPQPVSVITRQLLDDRNIVDFETVMRNTTGVVVDYTDSERVSYFARGFSIDAIQMDGATVSQGSGGGSFVQPDMAVIDHVEVLRGSAGLLRGSGNPSGLVNLVRKRPLDHLAFSGALQAGSWGSYRAEADLSSPLTEDGALRARMVLAFQDKDFFQKGKSEEKRVAYLVVEGDVTPSTTVSAGVDYSEVYATATWGNLPAGLDGKPLDLPRSTYLGATWNRWDRWNATFFGDVTHDFGDGWTARLNASHTELQTFDGGFKQTYMVVMPSYRDPYLFDVEVSRCDDSGSTQDAFSGSTDGPFELFGRTHEITFGAEAISNESVSTSPCNFSKELYRFDIRDWDPETSLPEPEREPVYTSRTITDTSQKGIYGSLRLTLTDDLVAIVGGRVSWWDYKSSSNPASNYSVNGEFTPYYGLVYDLSDTLSAYGSYTEIFSPQNAIDVNGNMLQPIRGESYEAGIKGEFYGGRLTGTLAAFYTEQVGRALTDIDSPNPCVPYYPTSQCRIAGGKSRSRGFEVEATGEVLPGWQINAGYTFNETKYLTDTVANTGRPLRTTDPKHLFKLFTTYKLDEVVDGLTIGGGMTAQSRIYATSGSGANLRMAEQPGYAIFNLMAGYQVTDETELQLNINNLFDRTYFTKVAPTGINYYYGEPFNVMLSLRFNLT